MKLYTLFKFGKCVDYGKFHTMGKNPPPKRVYSLGHVTAFNILNPINTFLEWMKLHSLNLPIRSTMVSPNFRGKLIFPERAVVWVTWSFLGWSHALNLNFANASTMVIVPHQGLKIPRFHQKRVWCRSRDRCLNFNPFNISGGMWWGRWGKRGCAGYHASQDS